MADSTALTMLMVDLGYLNPPAEIRLYMEQLLQTAESRLKKKGIVLDSSDFDDTQLLVSYAAWMYRKRATGEGMPRMLQYDLNNAIVHKTLSGEEADA